MAIIKLGGGVTDARGSVGGTTFSRNASGPFMGARTAGVQPRSTAQGISRASLSHFSKRWGSTLTDAQRAAWRTFSAANPTTNTFGDTLVLSGLAMFSKLNGIIAKAGGAAINSPPVSLAVTSPTAATIVAIAGGSIDVGLSGPGLAANEVCYMFLTGPMSAGRNFVSSQLRFIATITPMNASVSVTTPWVARFGQIPPAAGQRVFVRGYVANTVTGAISPGVQASDIF